MPSIGNDLILRTLRAQAWDRAKGELEAVRSTFWGPGSCHEGQFENLSAAISEFVTHVEDEGLAE